MAENKYMEENKSQHLDHMTRDTKSVTSLQPDLLQTSSTDRLQRRLGNRQIQLIAIGGSIGTATFVSIGNGLAAGGPGSLLLGFMLATFMMGLVNHCMAEMTTYMPVSGAFTRMAGHWVDEALGFHAGWNFFLYEAVLVPFEISALNLVLSFWSDDIPVAAIVAGCIVLYALINVFAVQLYGEAEFWLSLGKVLLFFIVFGFTFVTMCGGNPKNDAYGFRYWSSPGAFASSTTDGDLGRFHGFLAALFIGCFTVCGPEYMSMIAGETKYPRKYLRTAFVVTYYRFAFFFIGSAICVGIVVACNDPTLVAVVTGSSEGAGTAAASPYVIAMNNLGIGILPHITSALLVTSIFSAGNAYVYCGSRSLYSLAIEGKAPKFYRYTTRNGIPVYCLATSLALATLAFLSVSSSTATVIDWLINILSSAQIINYIIMCVTYIFYERAAAAQDFDRKKLPYIGWFQPYCAYIALTFYVTVVFIRGYAVFLPGKWDIGTFFTNYTMLIAAPILFLGWKFFHGTKFYNPAECDLLWEAPGVDAYEEAFIEDAQGFWTEIGQMFGLRRKRPSVVEAA